MLPIENLDKNCYLIISNNSFLFSSYLNNFLAIENINSMENDLKNAQKLIIEQRFKKFFLLLFGITAMKNVGTSRDVKKKEKKHGRK